MKTIRIALIILALIFGLSQVQSAQAGLWDKIKETTQKLGKGVKKDTKAAEKSAKKAGKKTKKETKRALRDSEKAIEEATK